MPRKRKGNAPGANFRNYDQDAQNQQRCPLCGEVRGVVRGRFVQHYNNGGRMVAPGAGVVCAGSGQRAATVRGTTPEMFFNSKA